jgi:hypothetical protein
VQDNGEDDKVTAFFQGPVGKTYTFQMMAKQDSYNVSRGWCGVAKGVHQLTGRTSRVCDISADAPRRQITQRIRRT